MTAKTFTCPGLMMSQPDGAPDEGYVACYRAGHKCTTEVVTDRDEHGVSTKVRCSCCGDGHGSMYVPHSMAEDEFAENLIPKGLRARLGLAAKRLDDDPYSSGIEPVIGGGVGVSVSGWGWWSVWINVESYADSDDYADTALQPGEAIRFGWRLIVAAVVCQWKRIGENRSRRIATKGARANRG